MSKQYNNAGKTLIVDEVIEVKGVKKESPSAFRLQLDSQLLKRDTGYIRDQIAQIGADSIITPAEKVLLFREYKKIIASHGLLLAKAEEWGISQHSDFLAYAATFTSLSNYLENIFMQMESNSIVDGHMSLTTAFDLYYNASASIEERIFRLSTGMLNGLDYRTKFEVLISSSEGSALPMDNTPTRLHTILLQDGVDVTSKYQDSDFTWFRVTEERDEDAVWRSGEDKTGTEIEVSASDLVYGSASMMCWFWHEYSDTMFYSRTGSIHLSLEVPGPQGDPGPQGNRGPAGSLGELGFYAVNQTLYVKGFAEDGSLTLDHGYLYIEETRYTVPQFQQDLSAEGKGYVVFNGESLEIVKLRSDTTSRWTKYNSDAAVSGNFWIIASFKKTGTVIHNIQKHIPQDTSSFQVSHFMEILGSEDLHNINVWAQANGIDTIFESIAMLEAFINKLVANNIEIGSANGFQFRAMKDSLGNGSCIPVFEVRYDTKLLFSVEMSTGVISFGKHFTYTPIDESIHTPQDRLIINANGQLDGNAIQVINSMNTLQICPWEYAVFPRNDFYRIKYEDEPAASIGLKFQNLFSMYATNVKAYYTLPADAINSSENGFLNVAIVAEDNSLIELFNQSLGIVEVGMAHYLGRYHTDAFVFYEIGVLTTTAGRLLTIYRELVAKHKASGEWSKITGPWSRANESFKLLGISNGIDVYGKLHVTDELSVKGLPAYASRAWVRYDGVSARIIGKENISSINYLGTGVYFVQFEVPMPDTAYGVICSIQKRLSGYAGSITYQTSQLLKTGFTVQTFLGVDGSSPIDADSFVIAVFR